MDAIFAEVNEGTERDAAAWARKKAKDPNHKILPKKISFWKRGDS